MSTRLRYSLTAALAVAGLLAAAPAAMALPGLHLEQRDGPIQGSLDISSEGAHVEVGPVNGSVSFGAIIRTADRVLIVFDPIRRIFSEVPLDEAAKFARRREEILANIPNPLPDGIPRPDFSAPQTARDSNAEVAGLPARRFRLKIGPQRLRVAFDASLPDPSDEVARAFDELGGAMGVPTSVRSQVGRALLRVERYAGQGKWVPVLTTTDAAQRNIPGSAFQPPKGLERVPLHVIFNDGSAARGASLPAAPSRGISAIPTHPLMRSFFWGSFSGAAGDNLRGFLNSAARVAMGTGYGSALPQYGVSALPGGLSSSVRIPSAPPPDVGAQNDARGPVDIMNQLGLQQLLGRAPRYWVCCGQDPLLAVFVREDQVDSSVWGGYHFFVPTETILVPWPLNIWIEPGVPWLIAKVHQNALGSDAGLRATARDNGTDTLGHEYIEAVTDPFPFSGWADSRKDPIWTQGELSDICFGTDHPRATVSGFALATYFSAASGTCVP